ncbi:MAG: hypothetical protein IKW74_01960 [Thermoguttaceae bacterium]|nr:hypothetical protein [Thermoguttaceae bacterium]
MLKTRLPIVYRLLGFQKAEDFAAAIEAHPTYISQIYKNGLNPSFERRLTDHFPEINLEYLRTGKGEPLLRETTPEEERIRRDAQVEMVVDILKRLEEPALSSVLEEIERYRKSDHFLGEGENTPPPPAKKTKKNDKKNQR